MPETRMQAERRAKRIGFPIKQVYCLEGDKKCYIAPLGIDTAIGRRVYAERRKAGDSKEDAAKAAYAAERQAKKSRK